MKTTTTLAALVAHCRKLARHQQRPDGELLRRFVEQHESAAFEELVERYAPLVWGVCRRILPGEADCEDAFQASFLSLVRQAGSIDPHRPLGAWLHTIAVRTAAKARTRLRRQPTQAIVPEQTTRGVIADELGNRELFRVVDEEIARLPALLREPFVLCCLEGRTRDEAAAALHCSVAAVKSRLERSRNLLRRRLERRGISLPAAFLVLGLTGEQVRASLCAKAFQCVLGSAPSAVAALVPSAGMSLARKLILTAMSLVVVSALGLGALSVVDSEPPQEVSTPAKDSAAKSPPSLAAEKPQSRVDRFGDPLPPGAIHRFGTLRFRHDSVYDLAFTPDGKQLIAGAGMSPLAVFDAMTGRKLREVGKTSPNNPAGFALSPDGKRVACCGFDLFVWDLETGRLIRELGCGRCQSVAFSPDGEKIAAVPESRAEIIVVDAATGKRLAHWTLKKGQPLQYDFRSLAFSPDGKFLTGRFTELREERPFVYTSSLSQIWLLDAEKGELVRTFGTADVSAGDAAFQPGSGRLATIGNDAIIRFWDVTTGKEDHRIPVAKGAGVLHFSADGRRCAVVNNESGTLIVLDAKSGRELRRIETGRSFGPVAVALSPDGEAVALGHFYRQSCVRVWEVASGGERLADAGHRRPATLSLSSDGRTLISRDEDGQVIQWDTETGEQRGRRTETRKEIDRAAAPWTGEEWTLLGPRWKLTYSYQTSMLEARSLDGSKLIGRTSCPSWPFLMLSPDGTHVAGEIRNRTNRVMLWNPEKEKEPRKLMEHKEMCQQLLFSHDGKRLITGVGTHNAHASSTLSIWDVATARLVHQLATNSAAGFMLLTADDRVLFTGGLWNDATVHAWDMETGKELACLADPSLKYTTEEQGGRSQLAISGLALSPDERFLTVVSSRDATSAVSIWETSSWKLVRAFAPTTPRNHVQSMILSRDGRSLFVANCDSTILQWDASGRSADGRHPPVGKVYNQDRLNELWQTLGQTPEKAYPAAWEMLDHQAESVPFLIGKLAPVQRVDEKRVRQLLTQLDSELFAEREEANRQLLALGEQTLPLLRQALKDGLSLEARKRVEAAIESLNRSPGPDQLRALRALAVLEWSKRSEAVEHLQRLAGGAPSAGLTQAARAARQRLKR